MKNGGTDQNPITAALVDPVRQILTDLGELGLQELLGAIADDTEALQSIPVLKWIITVGNAYSGLQTAFFIRKYARFIGPIRNAGDDGWDPEEVEELVGSEKEYRKLIEQTIISLDRYQTELKATLLGELFVQTFRYGQFSIDEYNNLSFSIELIHPHSGLRVLKEFYDCCISAEAASSKDERQVIEERRSKIDFSPLVHTGLLTLPAGASVVGNLGGAHLNKLGKHFYKYVIKRHEIEFDVATKGSEDGWDD